MGKQNFYDFLTENRYNTEISDSEFIGMIDLYIRQKRTRLKMPFPTSVNADDVNYILDCFKNKNFLQAVKKLKEATGWGLKESKDWIDAYRATLDKEETI